MNLIKESTLKNPPSLSSGRMTGNTTKLVDHAIQLLFEGKVVIAHDAWEDGKHEGANLHLYERILRRLRSEHHNLEDRIVTNKKNLEIQIL